MPNRKQWVGPMILFCVCVLVLVIYLGRSSSAHASRLILQDGNIYRASDVFGSKKYSNNSGITMLFGEANGLLLVGKGYELGENAHTTAGTRISLIQADGRDEQQITTENIRHAQFDKKGERVIYLTKSGDIYSYDVKSKKNQRLVSEASIPDISSDGSKLVYKKTPPGWLPGDYLEGSPGIAVKDLNSGLEKIVATVDGDYAPFWSPDGKSILVFNEGIHLMNADGSGRTRLTKPGDGTNAYGISDDALWSPDGKYFIYQADQVIFVLKLNLQTKTLESAGPIAKGVQPQWVEPGKSISVISADSKAGDPAVSVVALDGSVLSGNSSNGIKGQRVAPKLVPTVTREERRVVPESAIKLEPVVPKEIHLPALKDTGKERKAVPANAVIINQ